MYFIIIIKWYLSNYDPSCVFKYLKTIIFKSNLFTFTAELRPHA